MMIHLILPSGVRYQVTFADHFTSEAILNALASQKRVYGGTIQKRVIRDVTGQTVAAEDPDAGYWFDHPDTVVAIVKVVHGSLIEVKRIKGPPATPPEPTPVAVVPAVVPVAPAPVEPEPVPPTPPDGG